jgi:hypothetical protein
VMLMKKLLNQGKPMKQLVKNFKVTETQPSQDKAWWKLGGNWSCEIKAGAYIIVARRCYFLAAE